MNSRRKGLKTNNDKSAVGYVEKGKLARICHRWMSRSNGENLGREVIRNFGQKSSQRQFF